MKIINSTTAKNDLLNESEVVFDGVMVKGVADVTRRILAIDAELHADLEQMLLREGSKQTDLWGINLWCDADDYDDLVEFDSMINIRPRQNNRSRYVEDSEVRTQILEVVKKWVSL